MTPILDLQDDAVCFPLQPHARQSAAGVAVDVRKTFLNDPEENRFLFPTVDDRGPVQAPGRP
jgi:hypothetical protein